MIKKLLTILMCLACMAPISVSADQSATVAVSPAYVELTGNETFTVDIEVTFTAETETIELQLLKWDPTLARCIDIQEGNVFTNKMVCIMGSEINNTAGEIHGICWASTKPAQNMERTLATITFEARSAGNFSLYVEPEGTNFLRQGLTSNNATVLTNPATADFDPLPSGDGESPETPYSLIFGGMIVGIATILFILFILKRKKDESTEDGEKETSSIQPQTQQTSAVYQKSKTIKVKRHD